MAAITDVVQQHHGGPPLVAIDRQAISNAAPPFNLAGSGRAEMAQTGGQLPGELEAVQSGKIQTDDLAT